VLDRNGLPYLTQKILKQSVLNRFRPVIGIEFHNLSDKLVTGNIDRQQHWDLDQSNYTITYQLERNILDYNDRNTVIVTLRKKCYTKRCLRLEILIPVC
jgi:hypothetical protein